MTESAASGPSTGNRRLGSGREGGAGDGIRTRDILPGKSRPVSGHSNASQVEEEEDLARMVRARFRRILVPCTSSSSALAATSAGASCRCSKRGGTTSPS